MQTQDDNDVGINKYFTVYLLYFDFILIDDAQFIAMLSCPGQLRNGPYDETCIGLSSLRGLCAD